ncbi:MAG: twin-arginine translocase TatA/TatE family subunit [Dysgonamonadaceae bacterium]|mgnify:CR=1 FL=1|jgi:sec-independent protein translocase protein TatA|nr:twin-arginine translocase TatA/TatE family subunit [Dysgonamonadaceae bacterium]MDD3310087.1 twin-arginine translocase TatA/TatE family subunit [Dysgonamonadaceae bacterium]MDD3901323.1 twin-arginine translocase TatA/TatE family subunit [Dysgonamonadaceae bacterium]MDD4399722.1 twin-arginine translocase TatA/TatE family subunit [Dysgonamonadaceae bacterium]MEA5081257.1 twin-arginine translocase TatA/TatE family subunit [Dysgonamonadaceae bacterium]
MNIHGWEWLIILLAILLLFGGKKIPELMSGLGKGIRSFKKGLNDVEEEIKADPTDQNTNSTPSNNK